jgi:hypothetical protein
MFSSFSFKQRYLAIAIGLVLCVGSMPLNAQEAEIEIVNQDGEKVKPTVIEFVPDNQQQQNGQPRIRVQAGGMGGFGGAGGFGGGFGAQVGVNNKDGKIVVIDSDGKQREIDVSGAQSIIVSQSVKSIMEDGEEKRKSFGKAIIVGPDGQRQEFELAPSDAGNQGPRWNQMKIEPAASSYMIGVNCSPVSELLAAQLNLDAGTGLVVTHVSNDAPAATAGLIKHDILMFADDQQLSKTSDLTDVVQKIGKEEGEISLTLIRAGKEQTVNVSPVQRPANAFNAPQAFVFPNMGANKFQFRRMGPGVIIGPEFDMNMPRDFHAEMDKVREQMDKLRNEMKQQFQQLEKEDGDNF